MDFHDLNITFFVIHSTFSQYFQIWKISTKAKKNVFLLFDEKSNRVSRSFLFLFYFFFNLK